MSYRQLVRPIIPYRVNFGQCLKQVRSAFGAPGIHAWASHAASAARWKHYGRSMPNVMVPVHFSHYGVYDDGPGQYGHVVIWVPGRGFLSSPKRGTNSFHWYGSLEAVERAVGGKYLFWSEDINGKRVVEPVNKPAKKPTAKPTPSLSGKGDKMFMIALNGGSPAGETLFAVVGSNFWLEFTGQSAANNLIRQITGGTGNPALMVTKDFWAHCKRSATTGKNK